MLFSSHRRPNSFIFLMTTLSQITSLSVAEDYAAVTSCFVRSEMSRDQKGEGEGEGCGFREAILSSASSSE